MNVTNALEDLFWALGNVGKNAQRGFQLNEVSRATAESIKNSTSALRQLSEDDHAVIEEIVQYAFRFANSYISIHIEDKKKSVNHADHADQMLDATADAIVSRLTSHSYNRIAGKPVSRDDQLVKQLATAAVKEVQIWFQKNT